MARAVATNAVSEQTLTSSVSIGGSTLDLTLTAGAALAMPSGAGVFACIIIETDADDAEVVECTRSGTTCTLSGMTFAKAHNAGARVICVLSEDDIANFAKLDAANTFTLAQRFANGTTSAVGIAIRAANNGIASTIANTVQIVANATEALRVQASLITLFVKVLFKKQIALDETYVSLSGSDDYTVTSTDAPGIAVTTAGSGSTLTLPATAGVVYLVGLDPYATDPITVASLYTLNPGEAAWFWYSNNLGNYMKAGA